VTARDSTRSTVRALRVRLVLVRGRMGPGVGDRRALIGLKSILGAGPR
jgi:hypothetical protein